MIAEFTYDALGRRVETIEYDSTNITTRYYYDGWRVLSETDASNVVHRDYVYGNYIDETVMMVDHASSSDYFYGHDHLFSTVALFDSTGATVERYEYDAYGKAVVITNKGSDGIWFTSDDTVAMTSAKGNPYTFTGRRLDTYDSGAYEVMYYRNRYYDTETGRFLKRDPLGIQDGLSLVDYALAGGPFISRFTKNYLPSDISLFYASALIDINTMNRKSNIPSRRMLFNVQRQYSDGVNLYQYVNSSPTNSFDPFGLYDDRSLLARFFGWLAGERNPETEYGSWSALEKPEWHLRRSYVPVIVKGIDLPTDPITGIIHTIVSPDGRGEMSPRESLNGYTCICVWDIKQLCQQCCKVIEKSYRRLSGGSGFEVSRKTVRRFSRTATLWHHLGAETKTVVKNGYCPCETALPRIKPYPLCGK